MVILLQFHSYTIHATLSNWTMKYIYFMINFFLFNSPGLDISSLIVILHYFQPLGSFTSECGSGSGWSPSTFSSLSSQPCPSGRAEAGGCQDGEQPHVRPPLPGPVRRLYVQQAGEDLPEVKEENMWRVSECIMSHFFSSSSTVCLMTCCPMEVTGLRPSSRNISRGRARKVKKNNLQTTDTPITHDTWPMTQTSCDWPTLCRCCTCMYNGGRRSPDSWRTENQSFCGGLPALHWLPVLPAFLARDWEGGAPSVRQRPLWGPAGWRLCHLVTRGVAGDCQCAQQAGQWAGRLGGGNSGARRGGRLRSGWHRAGHTRRFHYRRDFTFLCHTSDD